MMQLLLDAGANVKMRTSAGRGCSGALRLLERSGSCPNASGTGNRPRQKGCARPQCPAFRSLFRHGHARSFRPAVERTLRPQMPGPRTAMMRFRRRSDGAMHASQNSSAGRCRHRAAEIRTACQSGLRRFRPPSPRSLDLLAKTGPSVVKQRGCFSCHHQGLPSLAGWYARRAGIDAAQIAETNRKLVYPILQRSDQLMQHGAAPAGEAATVAWQLIGLASDGQQADLFTDVAVNYIAATQMPDGSWLERWGRPPLEYSPVSATAVAIRALDLYGFSSRRQEFNARIADAAAWLAKTQPAASEEKYDAAAGTRLGPGAARCD